MTKLPLFDWIMKLHGRAFRIAVLFIFLVVYLVGSAIYSEFSVEADYRRGRILEQNYRSDKITVLVKMKAALSQCAIDFWKANSIDEQDLDAVVEMYVKLIDQHLATELPTDSKGNRHGYDSPKALEELVGNAKEFSNNNLLTSPVNSRIFYENRLEIFRCIKKEMYD